MSLLSHNELDIVLGPQRIELIHVERRLTLRGYRSHVHANEILSCEIPVDGEMAWGSALKMLETKLESFIKCKAETSVTLSDHFMHYILVPWLDKMNDEEEMVLARHCFGEVYGSVADTWEVRISPGKAGYATLASAVDSRLLEDLRVLLGRLGFSVNSIQPQLMAALNSNRASLQGRNAWIAFLEPGSLCLAVLNTGQLVWIRKLRIGDAWQEELSTLLEREAFLADAEVATSELFLWAPHLEEMEMPELGRWSIRSLKPSLKTGSLHGHVGLQTPLVGT